MDTLLYGFDARMPIRVADPNWSDLRRAQYLLRPEILRPLSVDTQVWPRVLPAGVTDGFAPDYWANLDALRHTCASKGFSGDAVTLIALAVCGNGDQASSLFVPCEPSTIDPAWQPLGWDVADNGLVSGLSNCGYRQEEVEALRPMFSPQLNEHGLFNSREAAEAFRVVSDKRVPEHAPFLIHRIFYISASAITGDGD